MKIEVYIEPVIMQLNQTFTYNCMFDVQPGMRVRVPFGKMEYIGIVEKVDVESDLDNIKDVIEVLDEKPLLNDEMKEMAKWMSSFYVCSMMSCFKTMLPPALRPSSNHAKVIYEDWIVLSSSDDVLTPKQSQVYESIKDDLPMKASILRKTFKQHINALISKGYIKVERRVKQNELVQEYEDEFHALTFDQELAISQINESNNNVILLHGVTGSGKTEVFLQLAQKEIEKGKQVLFLVPEIGLTPMMIQRVAARFGNRIAIYHSQLNAQEKYDQYKLVMDGKVDIVVGTRSSIFMPFKELGLILMDEEHDTSYKQDNMPRYHTRDVALWRAKYHNCKVILASATPSLESYARAYKGNYKLVNLQHRVNDTKPTIHIVDMKQTKSQNGFSFPLLNAIQDRLNKQEQVILLLNRRGYLPTVRCMDCNEVITCPDCDIALTYHKRENALLCHCCGRIIPFNNTCPKCKGHHFYQLGMGTEKLEETISSIFPSANILRMDADSTRNKNAHSRILKEFEENGDILIGTQMVAKGLDFRRVTLVGILQGDAALVRNDYRSSEIAYEMLEQASGRSGRADKPGEVYIQTFDPNHYVMKSVYNHDYLAFFQKEMQYRHLGVYPPYTYLATVIYSHEDVNKAKKDAIEEMNLLEGLKVLGPFEISKRMRKSRIRLVIKSNNMDTLNRAVWSISNYHTEHHCVSKQDITMYPLMLEE